MAPRQLAAAAAGRRRRRVCWAAARSASAPGCRRVRWPRFDRRRARLRHRVRWSASASDARCRLRNTGSAKLRGPGRGQQRFAPERRVGHGVADDDADACAACAARASRSSLPARVQPLEAAGAGFGVGRARANVWRAIGERGGARAERCRLVARVQSPASGAARAGDAGTQHRRARSATTRASRARGPALDRGACDAACSTAKVQSGSVISDGLH